MALKPAAMRRFDRIIGLPDLPATAALGAVLAAGLRRGAALALYGDLGAGKTTLARAILTAAGISGPVPSPSFSLVQSYDTPGLAIAHLDLYRLEDVAELEELGLEDALADGAVLIEWPEKAAGWLPDDTLDIRLDAPLQGPRSAHMTGPPRWAELFSRWTDPHAG